MGTITIAGDIMNNIQEKDWAEESWGGHSGISNNSDWCTVEKKKNDEPKKNADNDKKDQ
jgi:hypothetical protein